MIEFNSSSCLKCIHVKFCYVMSLKLGDPKPKRCNEWEAKP